MSRKDQIQLQYTPQKPKENNINFYMSIGSFFFIGYGVLVVPGIKHQHQTSAH